MKNLKTLTTLQLQSLLVVKEDVATDVMWFSDDERNAASDDVTAINAEIISRKPLAA